MLSSHNNKYKYKIKTYNAPYVTRVIRRRDNNNNNKGKGKGPGTCCSMKHDQKHFTIWQVAADWLAPRYSTAACYVTIQYQCLSQ